MILHECPFFVVLHVYQNRTLVYLFTNEKNYNGMDFFNVFQFFVLCMLGIVQVWVKKSHIG